MKKKIFIAHSLGFVLRNFIFSKFYKTIKKETKVYLLSYLYYDKNFLKEMEDLDIEVLPLIKAKPFFLWSYARSFRDGFHVAYLNNETWKLKRSPVHHKMNKKEILKSKILFKFFKTFTGKKTLKIMDFLETKLALKSNEANFYREIFKKYKPQLFFSPAPLINDEWIPLQVAREQGIKTAIYILSWDNLSTKQRPPFPVDFVFVWNERMKEELLNNYPSSEQSKIFITGSPQFDFYFDKDFIEKKEDFFKRIGLKIDKPLIVFSGVTPSLMPEENLIVERLIEDIKAGKFVKDVQLLVRLHPKDDGSRYKELMEKHKDVFFSIPGEKSKGEIRRWFPNDAEIKNLVSIVKYCDININVASTMTIDSALMGKPIINVKYYLSKNNAKPPWGIYIYDTTHYKPIVETKGVQIAYSPDELVEKINLYIENPEIDKEGRKKIVELVCGNLDGNAGERIAEKILEIIKFL